MKNITLLMVITFAIPCWTSGLNATESELSADDLVSYLNIHHKVFTFEHDESESANTVNYRILLYEKGEIISTTGWSRNTYPSTTTYKRTERIAIFHKDEGDFIDVTVTCNKWVSRFKIDKPESIGNLSLNDGGLHFDGNDRLILAYDVEKDRDGSTTVTANNSTVEGARAALVFQLETK